MKTLTSRTARNGSALLATGGVLRLDGQRDRLGLGEPVAVPKPLEEIEAKVAAQGLLDDLAVALAAARSPDLHCAQDFLVDGQCGPHLAQGVIIASGCGDAKWRASTECARGRLRDGPGAS